MMTRKLPASHRRRVRPLGAVVVLAAVLVAGCGHPGHPVSAADRRLCDQIARRVGSPSSARYKAIHGDCIQNLEHPERGGG
jgi:hypothetical protein